MHPRKCGSDEELHHPEHQLWWRWTDRSFDAVLEQAVLVVPVAAGSDHLEPGRHLAPPADHVRAQHRPAEVVDGDRGPDRVCQVVAQECQPVEPGQRGAGIAAGRREVAQPNQPEQYRWDIDALAERGGAGARF
uniref:(northern house mosquito) hypothetical protein n=1 Tax=Culex pipiens TaxID=7175 RepID=A0A8D8CA61_CULPI